MDYGQWSNELTLFLKKNENWGDSGKNKGVQRYNQAL
ncbi:hypothetical protein HNQ88_004492 [Aureibacter tunicatorum]|uniref:Uncharacterized protein n=1 Tax=Aureibacter tunicatorum TaxID=866807 RepID=A0AAE4BUT9_9BACT|nr:hypothetical protein [Aureibacter tunicatorum]BDD06750.1 hypothetical protein AUTU_42330 [Aureibacter tunicatorum]